MGRNWIFTHDPHSVFLMPFNRFHNYLNNFAFFFCLFPFCLYWFCIYRPFYFLPNTYLEKTKISSVLIFTARSMWAGPKQFGAITSILLCTSLTRDFLAFIYTEVCRIFRWHLQSRLWRASKSQMSLGGELFSTTRWITVISNQKWK